MKVLIVAAPEHSEAISRTLRASGILVTTVESAEAAIRLIATQRVNLILCNLKLPQMSGLEFARVAKHKQSFKGVSLVAMLTSDDGWERHPVKSDHDRALEAGFKAFMRAPFDAGLPTILRALA